MHYMTAQKWQGASDEQTSDESEGNDVEDNGWLVGLRVTQAESGTDVVDRQTLIGSPLESVLRWMFDIGKI
jgi:hypothetical protein